MFINLQKFGKTYTHIWKYTHIDCMTFETTLSTSVLPVISPKLQILGIIIEYCSYLILIIIYFISSQKINNHHNRQRYGTRVLSYHVKKSAFSLVLFLSITVAGDISLLTSRCSFPNLPVFYTFSLSPILLSSDLLCPTQPQYFSPNQY